ncbi:MAG: NUDIX domain-containing protein, partial [Firmicutes bacterium]|nr:NUDIX domain-containing protein [Bacillota bacterium]
MAKYSMDDIALKLQGRPSGVVGKRREYAVLMPLVKVNGEICFLFEVRSQDVAQPGDVCFPGGRIEEGETVVEAAVREAREEIGLD